MIIERLRAAYARGALVRAGVSIAAMVAVFVWVVATAQSIGSSWPFYAWCAMPVIAVLASAVWGSALVTCVLAIPVALVGALWGTADEPAGTIELLPLELPVLLMAVALVGSIVAVAWRRR